MPQQVRRYRCGSFPAAMFSGQLPAGATVQSVVTDGIAPERDITLDAPDQDTLDAAAADLDDCLKQANWNFVAAGPPPIVPMRLIALCDGLPTVTAKRGTAALDMSTSPPTWYVNTSGQNPDDEGATWEAT